jgi:hypothetical protein
MKSKLLKCRGQPDEVEFAEPGGPFFWKTEIWKYKHRDVGEDAYWFGQGKLYSGPSV